MVHKTHFQVKMSPCVAKSATQANILDTIYDSSLNSVVVSGSVIHINHLCTVRRLNLTTQ